MAERFVGIDVALREHRIAVLDRDGEAVGPSFTITASKDGVATLEEWNLPRIAPETLDQIRRDVRALQDYYAGIAAGGA